MMPLNAIQLDESDLISKVKYDHSIEEINANDFKQEVIDIFACADFVIFRGRKTVILKDRYGMTGVVSSASGELKIEK